MRAWQRKDTMRSVVLQAHSDGTSITCMAADARTSTHTDAGSDSVVVTGSTDGSLMVWDVTPGACAHITTLKYHKAPVNAIRRVRDTVVTASADETLRLVRLGSIVGARDGGGGGGGGGDGGGAATATKKPKSVKLKGHKGAVFACDLWVGNPARPDDLVVVSGGLDGSLRVWSGAKGKLRHCVTAHASLVGPRTGVQCLQLARDGRHAVSGGNDYCASLWDVEVGKAIGTMRGHSDTLTQCHLDPRRVVTASADGTLRVWDPRTLTCQSTLVGHTNVVRCFEVCGAGGYDTIIASGGDDRSVRLWDLRSDVGGSMATLTGHLDGVTSLAWDWTKVVTGASAGDPTVRLWSVQTANCLRVCRGHRSKVSAVALRGSYALSASWDGSVRVWHA